MMKQTIAVLLAVFCLTLCLAALAEAPQVFTAAPEVQQVTGLGENTNTAAEGYIRKVFGLPDLAPVSRAPKRGSLLDPDSPEKKLYDALAAGIQSVVAGKRSDTLFRIPIGDIFPQNRYTANELGVEEFNSDNIMIFSDQFDVDSVEVFYALLNDYPYELFWFDKTRGLFCELSEDHFSYYPNEAWLPDETTLDVSMCVAQEYAMSLAQGTTAFDTSFISAIQTAVAKAQQIVADNRVYSDIKKLTAYRDQIRELTGYNENAAADNTTPYGNPWQVIWVFDGDPSTKVVCEGYSKAFQYLCDLSDFQTDITVNLATGEMRQATETQGEGHMWNIVTMGNGKNYMVDVTNYHLGANMFMGTYEAMVSYYGEGDPAGYRFVTDNNNRKFVYTYDTETANTFTGAERTLAEKSFKEEPDPAAYVAPPHEVTWTISPEHPNMNTGVIIQLDQEYTAIYYSVKDADNETVAEGQLSDTDAIDIQGLSAGDYTVSIRCAEDTSMLEEIDVHITILEAPTLIAYLSVIGEPVATYVPTFLDGDDIAITYQIDSAIGVSHRYLILETGENDGYFSMIELGDSAEGTWTLTPEEYGEFVDKGTIHLNAALTDINESNFSAEQTAFQIVSCDLRLPENLTTIEAEAFKDVAAKSVYVPEHVIMIEDGAFDLGMTILCRRGSHLANEWATGVPEGLTLLLLD